MKKSELRQIIREEIKRLSENNIDYYQYSTAKIIVLWNGNVQRDMGRFKTAKDALNAIKTTINSMQGFSAPSTKGWVIQTPDGNLNVDDYIQFKSNKWVSV